jgi:SAM-dependent methyltransferase
VGVIERRTVSTLGELRAAYNAIYARAEFGERDGLYRLVLRLLEVAPEHGPILDVGCGAGPFDRYVAARDLQCVGLDLADEALGRARAAGCQRLVLGQGERLPFAEAAFARVVCLGNLEHFLDPQAGARELARVLAPEGRVAIMLPNAYYSGDLWRVVRTGRGPDHHQAIDRFATCEEWRDVLEAGGLRVLDVRRWDKGKLWKRLFPFHLAYHFVFLATRA